MLPYSARIESGEITETYYMYGGYRMTVAWFDGVDFAQVTVYDLGARLPLMWSKSMTKAQARGAHQLFESIGYFDMPV